MSYYYKYTFISPDPLYARIQEELKSYLDTGAVDSLLFPIWTEDCLNKLGRATYKIENVILNMCDFECRLPPDFTYVREAWLTTSEVPISHQKPGAFYQEITTCLNGDYVPDTPSLSDNTCNPEYVSLVYKTTTRETNFSLHLRYLLKPGNINARHHCYNGSPNLDVTDIPNLHNHHNGTSSIDSFDINGNKFSTNFREGQVYLVYYSNKSDENGYQLIPDNFRIQRFIEAYIKQKIFEMLYNQITDETFNQVEKKYMMYKQQADEAYIIAYTEIKKETVYDRFRAMKRQEHSLDIYNHQMYGNLRRRYRRRL